MDEYVTNTPLQSAWDVVGIRQHHGICFPLSAMRSQLSCGIGEFGELSGMGDWCKEVGIDLIQLLPINDNCDDPSPFNAVSSMAINPIYLSLHMLPDWKEPLHELRDLNKTEIVHYHEVRRIKELLLRRYYQKQYPLIYLTEHFQKYVQQNTWLTPYALYKTLKRQQDGKSWTEWPDDIKYITEEKVEELSERLNNDIVFHYFVQFLCHMQLQAAKKHLNINGILLMGDMPILVSKDSADAWWYHKLFDFTHTAGAPPDIYNEEGQNWGFPVYNWDAFRKTDFVWWRSRLFHANQYYNVYRLDHALGFFHLWKIPEGKEAKDGFYCPKKGPEAYKQGKEILEVIAKSSLMVPIAEDIGGIIAPEVTKVLHELGMPGIRWTRWERDWDGDESFIPYEDYHPLNLTTISTHDSETLEQWWNNDPEDAKKFCKFKGWKYTKKLDEQKRLEILRDAHKTPTAFHVNLLQEYLALFPGELSWDEPSRDRINVPGKVLDTNWVFRFKPTLEEIYHHKGLREKMKEILS